MFFDLSVAAAGMLLDLGWFEGTYYFPHRKTNPYRAMELVQRWADREGLVWVLDEDPAAWKAWTLPAKTRQLDFFLKYRNGQTPVMPEAEDRQRLTVAERREERASWR